MSHRRILFVLLLLITARSQADDWPRFLGRQSDGRSSEIDLIDEMPSSGPMILWRTKLGTGMSNVSVSGPLAVTLYQDAESQFAVCLNSSTGEIIWKTAIAPAYENAMGNGPRATPTIGDTSIYCYSGQGILTALN
ncbi:MAG: PQQ-like beta-propeller repeat protein, partial [Planctomycetaceae bacterium]|nr:PQQ-like beta-propeller repeat protein [Planctomycetaceae bacterium]